MNLQADDRAFSSMEVWRYKVAIAAMQGMLAASDLVDSSISDVAKYAVAYADTLLKELKS